MQGYNISPKGSTIELLLGTDLLTKLGFDLVKTIQKGEV